VDDAKYGSKTKGNDEDNGNNITYANVSQLRHDWAEANARCWWQHGCNKTNDTSKMRKKMPARQGQQHWHNAGNNDNAMLAMMPATFGQGHQRNTGKDTSAASAKPLKAKLLWSDAGDGNNAIGDDEETAMMPCMLTCRNCSRIGQTPV
jgi:hypothetical protein